MILSDKTIRKLLEENKLILAPLDEPSINSNGYDMLLESFKLAPGEFKLIRSVEKIEMPPNIIAIPYLRTTFAFQGLILSPGIIDAGYQGYLKFALYNSSDKEICLSSERLVNLIFMKLDLSAENPFGTRAGEVKDTL